MMYRKIFLVLVPLLVMAAGCDGPAADIEEDAPYVAAKGDTVLVCGPQETVLSLRYELRGSDDYSAVFAECEQEWISDWDYSQQGAVTFTVAANDSEQPREAVIGLRCADSPSTDYRVVQEGIAHEPDPEPDPDPDPDPEPFSIEFVISELEARSAVVEAIPSRDDVMFYYSADKAGLSDEELKGYLESLAAVYVAMGLSPDIRSAIMDYFAGTGHSKTRCEDLYPDTDYVPYAFVFDLEGDYDGPAVRGEIFHTPAAVVSDAAITVGFDEYFDGDEVCQYYPAYADAAGSALLPVAAQLSGDVAEYYYQVFDGDLTDPGENSDELVINNLIYRGISSPKAVLYVDFDTELTILAVAVNAEGEYGEVFRVCFTLPKGGESPVQYFGQYL